MRSPRWAMRMTWSITASSCSSSERLASDWRPRRSTQRTTSSAAARSTRPSGPGQRVGEGADRDVAVEAAERVGELGGEAGPALLHDPPVEHLALDRTRQPGEAVDVARGDGGGLGLGQLEDRLQAAGLLAQGRHQVAEGFPVHDASPPRPGSAASARRPCPSSPDRRSSPACAGSRRPRRRARTSRCRRGSRSSARPPCPGRPASPASPTRRATPRASARRAAHEHGLELLGLLVQGALALGLRGGRAGRQRADDARLAETGSISGAASSRCRASRRRRSRSWRWPRSRAAS